MVAAQEAINHINELLVKWQDRSSHIPTTFGGLRFLTRDQIRVGDRELSFDDSVAKMFSKNLELPAIFFTREKIPDHKALSVIETFRELHERKEISLVVVDNELTSVIDSNWKIASYRELLETVVLLLKDERFAGAQVDQCFTHPLHCIVRIYFPNREFKIYEGSTDAHYAMVDLSTSEAYRSLGVVRPNFNATVGLFRQVCSNGLKVIDRGKTVIRYSRGEYDAKTMVDRIHKALNSSTTIFEATAHRIGTSMSKRLKDDEIVLSNLREDGIEKRTNEEYPATVMERLARGERTLFNLVQSITESAQALQYDQRAAAEIYANDLLVRHTNNRGPIIFTRN